MIRLKSVRVDITYDGDLLDIIAKKLKVNRDNIIKYRIHKKSIDARSKMLFSYVYDFDIEIACETEFLKKTRLKNVSITPNEEYITPTFGNTPLNKRPIIIGMGPAGLFAAYFLAEAGFKPIIFERGESIDARVKTIAKFWETGILNKESNVQFGEGGAGTFSDGKLNTLVSDKYNRMKKIFEIFVEHGAPKEIMYDNKPHIGTDLLRDVIVSMRRKIIEFGGEVHFNSLMEDIIIKDNKVTGVVVNNKEYETDVLILAIGHSARDTFEKLMDLGISLEAKPFAVGIRIMHPQDIINENQYPINYKFLPPASYKLTYQASTSRGVYTFCMCPGGYVVNASSQNSLMVVNGMSDYKRDSGTANSAIIVTVNPKDFGTSPLDGINFIENIEKKAYEITGGLIPIQTFGNYKKKQVNKVNETNLAVKGNYKEADINTIFPEYINVSLKEGITHFGTKIKGFDNDEALILAPESRTSSPIKIPRDTNLNSNILGIYPCGEGSGYAGGITTSAIDGVKVFEKIINKYYINY